MYKRKAFGNNVNDVEEQKKNEKTKKRCVPIKLLGWNTPKICEGSKTIDYYAILGLKDRSGSKQIRDAYKKLCLKYHPDKNPDDPLAQEIFHHVQDAYNMLIDTSLRYDYDHHVYKERLIRQGMMETAENSRGMDDGPLGVQCDGENEKVTFFPSGDGLINYDVELEEGQMYIEGSVTVKYKKTCEYCKGTKINNRNGEQNKKIKKDCSLCCGRGTIQKIYHGTLGTESTYGKIKCYNCLGLGEVINRSKCESCKGSGASDEEIERTMMFKTPLYVNDDARKKQLKTKMTFLKPKDERFASYVVRFNYITSKKKEEVNDDEIDFY